MKAVATTLPRSLPSDPSDPCFPERFRSVTEAFSRFPLRSVTDARKVFVEARLFRHAVTLNMAAYIRARVRYRYQQGRYKEGRSVTEKVTEHTSSVAP